MPSIIFMSQVKTATWTKVTGVQLTEIQRDPTEESSCRKQTVLQCPSIHIQVTLVLSPPGWGAGVGVWGTEGDVARIQQMSVS